MKKDTHPKNHRPVIFEDSSNGARFLVWSTIETEQTGKWEDGETYPLHQVEISSTSHPFYTGAEKVLDTAGRVEKFKARQAQASKAKAKPKNKSPKKADEPKAKAGKQSSKKASKTSKTPKTKTK